MVRADLVFVATIKHFVRVNKWRILAAFCLYVLACAALILANFNYVDDIDRNLHGGFFEAWSRHSANALSRIFALNAGFYPNMFPYTIFLALLILSVSSIMLIAALDKSLLKSKCAILVSLTLGLSPYYLENLSYKFDSPFMALSVFASIFPFLFVRHTRLFALVSVLGLLVMLTSYQASNGIYLMIMLVLAFRAFLAGDFRGAKRVFLLALLSYIAACFIFWLGYTPLMTYANNAIMPLKYLAIGVVRHWAKYVEIIAWDFSGNPLMLHLLAGFGLIFIVKSALSARISKPLAALCAIIVLLALGIASFGLYAFIIRPHLHPRAMIGFGALVAILGLCALDFRTRNLTLYSAILSVVLAQYVIGFANFYGQSLKQHDDYQRFRFTLMLGDLSKFLDDKERNIHGNFNILVDGSAGLSPNLLYSSKHYPLLIRLVPMMQNDFVWGVIALSQYGAFFHERKDCANPPTSEVLVDSYYHTIKRANVKGEVCYYVTYKDGIKHHGFTKP